MRQLFEPIRVSDDVLKYLQENGLVSKEPVKISPVKKEDIPQLKPSPSNFELKIEQRYICGEEI